MGSIWAVITRPVKPISVMIRYMSQKEDLTTIPLRRRPPSVGLMRIGSRSYLLWRTELIRHPLGSQPAGGAEITIAHAIVTRPWITPHTTKVDWKPDDLIMPEIGITVRAAPPPYEPATRPAQSPRLWGNPWTATPMQPP